MKSNSMRISHADMDTLSEEYFISADTRIPIDANKLKIFARSNPDQICYPVIRSGGRNGIARDAFLRFTK